MLMQLQVEGNITAIITWTSQSFMLVPSKYAGQLLLNLPFRKFLSNIPEIISTKIVLFTIKLATKNYITIITLKLNVKAVNSIRFHQMSP